MNAEWILTRLRRFLSIAAITLFVGTLVELTFIDHTQEPIQWIPFLLCGLGIVAIVASLVRPERRTILAMRACMVLVALGSLFGMYEHIEANMAFRLETHPRSTAPELVAAALGGAGPLLAPGVLVLAGVLAVAATYYHPALDARRGQPANAAAQRRRSQHHA